MPRNGCFIAAIVLKEGEEWGEEWDEEWAGLLCLTHAHPSTTTTSVCVCVCVCILHACVFCLRLYFCVRLCFLRVRVCFAFMCVFREIEFCVRVCFACVCGLRVRVCFA